METSEQDLAPRPKVKKKSSWMKGFYIPPPCKIKYPDRKKASKKLNPIKDT